MNLFEGMYGTKIISAMIADRSTYGKQQMEFISAMINDFESSETRKFMDIAERYYKNKNDIKDARRRTIGRTIDDKPVMVEANTLSNKRISHDFLRKLTKQKLSYLIGKPFILTEISEGDKQARSFFEAVQPYLDEKFFYILNNIGRDSIVKRIGWLQVYYDETGKLRFRRCEPEEVIPFWRDNDHTELDAVIRKYMMYEFKNGEKQEITYIEYYLPDGVFYYKQDKDGLHIDSERAGKQSHFNIVYKNEKGEVVSKGVNWKIIPFIPFKYDSDEGTLLERIKDCIDDYDSNTSLCSNLIHDFPNSVTVVKNYDGTSKVEFVENKNLFRTIFVTGDGDANTLDTPLNIAEIDTHLERLRQDIYEFGQGVNTADKDIRDTSGVALRFIYADLDMDCVNWGAEMRMSLRKLFWFIQQDLLAKTGEDFNSVRYSIVFNTDVIVNETETIANCAVSSGVISQETIAAMHPWVLNAKKEVAEVNKRAEEDAKLQITVKKASTANKSPNNSK